MKIKFSKIAALLLTGVVCLAPGCTDYQSDINDIYSRIDKLAEKTTVSSLADQVSGINATVEGLKAGQTSLETQLSDLKKTVSNLTARCDEFDKSIKSINSDINGIVDRLGKAEANITNLQTNFKDLSGKVDDLTTAFNNFKTEVSGKIAELEGEDKLINSKIDEINGKITSINSQIATVDEALAAEVKARKDADKALGDEIAAEVEARKAAIDGLDKKVDEVEADLKKALADSCVAVLKAAEEKLNAAIAEEKAAREAADKVLADADKTLEEKIAAEEAARIAKDNLLAAADELEAKARAAADEAAEKYLKENYYDKTAVDGFVAAEALARSAMDTKLQGMIGEVNTKVTKLQNAFTEYKALTDAAIESLKTRADAAEAAIANIQNVQIPALQNYADSLNADVKDSIRATNATIARMQAAIEQYVIAQAGIDKGQSDSLKMIFNDFVLTETFEAYKTAVETQLKAKADTATVNAAIRTITSMAIAYGEKISANALAIANLQQYAGELKQLIADNAEAIASLQGECAAIQEGLAKAIERINDNQAKIEQLQKDYVALAERVAAAEGEIENLKDRMDEAEADIANLMARIQSIEFVPDYDDCLATINYAFVQDTNEVFKSMPSELTYKVYPAELADSLAKAINAMIAKDNNLAAYFDVVSVERRKSTTAQDNETLTAGLQILSAEATDRTKGAITFTVKGVNTDAFYAYWSNIKADLDVNPSIRHASDEYQAKVDALDEAGLNQLASCFVIENNANGNVITSEYNVWAGNVSVVNWGGFKIVKEGEKPVTIRNAWKQACHDSIPYTNTEVQTICSHIQPYIKVNEQNSRSSKSVEYTFEDAKKALGIDNLGIYFVAFDTLGIVDGKNHDLLQTPNEAVENAYTLLKKDGKYWNNTFDEWIPENIKTEKLAGPSIAKNAIGTCEIVMYRAFYTNGYDASSNNTAIADLHITKEKAAVELNFPDIKWSYTNDVATDAAIYGGDTTATYHRNASNSELAIDLSTVETESLDRIGCEAKDFFAKKAILDSARIAPVGTDNFTLLANDKTGLNLNKTSFNDDFDSLYVSLDTLLWDKAYEFYFTIPLEFADITVKATVNTYDRNRDAVVFDFGKATAVYEKDFNKNIAFAFCTGAGTDFTMSSADDRILFSDYKKSLYNSLTYLTPSDVASDEFVADNKYKFMNVSADGFNDGVNNYYPHFYDQIKWDSAKYGEEIAVADTTHTYYGQEIIMKGTFEFEAPKYDFIHNTWYVFDPQSKPAGYDVKGENKNVPFFSQVEPNYTGEGGSKWNLKHFDVSALKLPEAFIIVDETATKFDTVGLGLDVNFMFKGDFVPGSMTDDRSNDPTELGATYITIDPETNYLAYHGWDEQVPVYATLGIKNSDGSVWNFPTSFDDDFECIYASKVTDGFTTGRYADYQVVKFNPLHDFASIGEVEIPVFNATMYSAEIFKQLTLRDQRIYDEKDPDSEAFYAVYNTTKYAPTGNAYGIELFKEAAWMNGEYGFAGAADYAYDIKDSYEIDATNFVPSEDIRNFDDIKDKISVENNTLYFDYEGQMKITDQIKFTVNCSLIWPWIEKAAVAPISVTIKKTADSSGK